MHLSDAFISPTVAGVFALASAVPLVLALRKVRRESFSNIPLMGVMGAFIFAIQMINFTLPGTGSSGHLTGGILLAVLLGPLRGYLVMTSILLIQCLLFADGGILALGCNLFNMGVCSCLIAYPLLFAPWKSSLLKLKGKKRFSQCALVSIFTCAASAVIGAFFVTLQTEWSGITEWSFTTFLTFMVTIHLLIGLVEGVATAALLCFLLRYKPELLGVEETNRPRRTITTSDSILPDKEKEQATDEEDEGMLEEEVSETSSFRSTVVLIFASSLLLGGMAPRMASALPDGLEWSMEQAQKALEGSTKEYFSHKNRYTSISERIQRITAFMPDYEGDMAGITGALCVLTIVCVGGYGIQRKSSSSQQI